MPVNFEKLHIPEVGGYCPKARKRAIYRRFELEIQPEPNAKARTQRQPQKWPEQNTAHVYFNPTKQHCKTSLTNIENP